LPLTFVARLLSLGWFLVDADDVAAGIAEAGGDFGGVDADGLDDFAACGGNGVNSGRRVVDHDVEEVAGSGGRAAGNPGSADLADGVVESGGAVAASADIPAENALIEFGGAGDIDGRKFDVADFSVCVSRWH